MWSTMQCMFDLLQSGASGVQSASGPTLTLTKPAPAAQ